MRLKFKGLKFEIIVLGLRSMSLVILLSLKPLCQVKALMKLKIRILNIYVFFLGGLGFKVRDLCFFGFVVLFGLQLFSRASVCNSGNCGFVQGFHALEPKLPHFVA